MKVEKKSGWCLSSDRRSPPMSCWLLLLLPYYALGPLQRKDSTSCQVFEGLKKSITTTALTLQQKSIHGGGVAIYIIEVFY
jgi:hypothetical protein